MMLKQYAKKESETLTTQEEIDEWLKSNTIKQLPNDFDNPDNKNTPPKPPKFRIAE